MNGVSGISEKWEGKGYWSGVNEEDDAVVLVGYKGQILAAFYRWAVIQAVLDGVCERHEARLIAAVEAVR